MLTDIHVKNRLFLSDFNQNLKISRKIFLKFSNIKFQENPFNGQKEFLHLERNADSHDEAYCPFSKFRNTPK